MKITAFNSSPRAEKGNTHVMVSEFLSGAKESGAGVENIFLIKKNIKHCQACFGCWIKTPGKCVVGDDMEELLEKFISSDIVVFATPLYVYNVSGIMKIFIDRLLPIYGHNFEKGKSGEYKHPKRHNNYPGIIVISNCGFPEQTHFCILSSYFRHLARESGMELIAEIYRGEGELLRAKSFMLKPIVEKYKKLLKRAGKEIVENQKISDEILKEMEKPMIPYDTYTEKANKYWEELLSEPKRGE